MNKRFIPRFVYGCLFFWLMFSFNSRGQTGARKTQCETCFTSEITKAVKKSDHCTDYEITVTYSGRCEHALSHLTIAIPHCADVKNLSNTHSCSQSTGFDPTTGLTGIKIENNSNFGKTSVKKLVVAFTLCGDASCTSMKCWQPVIAYKASTCFELDTLKASCPSLKVHLEKQNASCFGVADGHLTAVVDEGKAPYSYLWSNGATTASLANLAAGSYSVTVKDASSAQTTASETITQPAEIVIASTIVDASCDGTGDGSITASVSGGNGGIYSYLWNTGATTKDVASLKAGTYSLVVKDSAGCSAQATFTIKNIKQLVLTANTTSPGCSQSNGAISITATGGTEPYAFLWSSGATSASLGDLAAGSYQVTVTDSEGCSIKGSYFLRENNTLRVSFSVKTTSCLDDASGAITLTVSGGNPPYSYSWSNGATTKDLAGLTANAYTVTVTDSLGCKINTRITVPKNTFQVSSQITQPKCFGDATGAISATASGGVAPYAYSWSSGETSPSISGLPKGTYILTIVDSTGCSRVSTYVISGPAELKASASVTSVSCSEFSIDLTPSGGTLPYQYEWSTGAKTQDVSGLSPGTYSVTINDVNGCHLEKTVSIDSIAMWACSIEPPIQAPACLSANNMIITSITDATSYLWTLSSSDSSWLIQSGTSNDTLIYTAGKANSLATFTVLISKNGCSQSCSFTVGACLSSGEPPENCNDCYRSRITKSRENSCSTYVVKVFAEGYCENELSHFAIAIPCGGISHYSNSGGWPMTLGTDPISGLTGLSVNDIDHFGDRKDYFTVTFKVCSSQDCADTIRQWDPIVSYKTAKCVSFDTLEIKSSSFSHCAYPNPFRNSCRFEFDSDDDDHVSIEICDQFGNKVFEDFECDIVPGERKSVMVDGDRLKDNLYIYKIRSKGRTSYGKLFKLN